MISELQPNDINAWDWRLSLEIVGLEDTLLRNADMGAAGKEYLDPNIIINYSKINPCNNDIIGSENEKRILIQEIAKKIDDVKAAIMKEMIDKCIEYEIIQYEVGPIWGHVALSAFEAVAKQYGFTVTLIESEEKVLVVPNSGWGKEYDSLLAEIRNLIGASYVTRAVQSSWYFRSIESPWSMSYYPRLPERS